jgi:hypothetical protein
MRELEKVDVEGQGRGNLRMMARHDGGLWECRRIGFVVWSLLQLICSFGCDYIVCGKGEKSCREK